MLTLFFKWLQNNHWKGCHRSRYCWACDGPWYVWAGGLLDGFSAAVILAQKFPWIFR